jgi:hypothetical protein
MPGGMAMKVMIIRQPDIDSYLYLSDEFGSYGRFGITHTGSFYVLPFQDSNPPNTLIGGFWAANKVKDILYLYPKGASLDFEIMVREIIETRQITEIAEAAGIGTKH